LVFVVFEIGQINSDCYPDVLLKGPLKAVPKILFPQCPSGIGERRIKYQTQCIQKIRLTYLILVNYYGMSSQANV